MLMVIETPEAYSAAQGLTTAFRPGPGLPAVHYRDGNAAIVSLTSRSMATRSSFGV